MRIAAIGLLLACSTAAAQPAMKRGDIKADVATLEKVLSDAWAYESRATIDTFKALPGPLDEAAGRARDDSSLCAELAGELRRVGITVMLRGATCGAAPPAAAGPGALDTVPTGKNYRLHIDHKQNHDVAILTIAHFVDPSDAGWQGFADALGKLAKQEFVFVDLQTADGDDPRAGFAILAALGREDYGDSYFQAPAFRDGTAAKAAREAFGKLGRTAPAPRSRKLWSQLTSAKELQRMAREVAPGITRTTPPVKVHLFVGPGCGRACQLVVHLARWRVEPIGSFDNTTSGDELGAVTLPHSGIVAIFPTASYGPYVIGDLERRPLGADYAKTLLAGIHETAQHRAESIAWRTRKLPVCNKLPIDRKALSKAYGCRDDSKVTTGTIELVNLELSVEAATAKKFLATCNLHDAMGEMDIGMDGSSWATIYGTRAQILQVLAAPFVTAAKWDCPTHYEPN